MEGITEYRLDNGLRVLLFPDPTKSTITVNVTYMVGSRHEDYGETGMAHLLEHLLFMGSKNHPDIKKELQDRGARPNGTTWYDRTNYFETFAASDDNLAWALSMEADRMVNSFVAKKDLDSEMTVVRNEMEAGENSPPRVLLQKVLAAAFEWHNYGKLTIGARSDVERVPIERLQAFYRHFYQPDNALLVVAGKFDEQKALALIQKTFGAIPKPQRQLRRTYTVEPAQDGERQVVVRRVGDIQYVGAAWHIPPGSHEEYPAIEMAVAILGDQPSGRLYKALVETKKAATVSMNAFQLKEPGFAYASASVRMDSSLEDARKALLDTIAEIRTKPFTRDELERQRTRWLKNFELQMNDPQDVALELSEWQAMGDWRLMFLHRDRIEKVTLEQVQKAAEKYFIPSNCTVGLFIPEKEPVRVQPPEPPDVDKLVEGYTGRAVVSQGESFEATPANIDRRTIRGEIGGGLSAGAAAEEDARRPGDGRAQPALRRREQPARQDLRRRARRTDADAGHGEEDAAADPRRDRPDQGADQRQRQRERRVGAHHHDARQSARGHRPRLRDAQGILLPRDRVRPAEAAGSGLARVLPEPAADDRLGGAATPSDALAQGRRALSADDR